MPLKYAAIVPHPPIMVPDVGKAEGLKPIEKTVNGMLLLTREISKINPEIVIIISPHGQVFLDKITIRKPKSGVLKGSLWQFGASQVELNYKTADRLIEKIIKKAQESGLKVEEVDDDNLDHGILAPMYYIDKGFKKKPAIVSINISYEGIQTHYKFGKIINDILKDVKENILFVASGDLSHALNENAPAGFNKEGEVFDSKLVKLLKAKKFKDILTFDPFWVDEAAECGLRSISACIGVLEKIDFKEKFFSYEGPYGVGYLVMGFEIIN